MVPPDTSGLEVFHFREVGQVLLLPKSHRLARKRQLRLADCRELQLIAPPSGRPQRQRLEASLPPFQVAAEAEGWELTLHFVSLGLGVAVVNSFCPVPRGFMAQPLHELPKVSYRVFLPRAYSRPQARELARLILDS